MHRHYQERAGKEAGKLPSTAAGFGTFLAGFMQCPPALSIDVAATWNVAACVRRLSSMRGVLVHPTWEPSEAPRLN